LADAPEKGAQSGARESLRFFSHRGEGWLIFSMRVALAHCAMRRVQG
jgi:hypothetical protein